ncbi:hypothetical protein M407DRAFT_25859 [Tulasnella calospora MUT 4182]|uniref:Uncharacterized protein n=1 Tax=Tulasnella calospora MUT 4182 TaxID=1051891 RepID=A0A0C3KTK7_9AGAM|nr:hypothetical protein M407DRAFT_25859 [Tulasnella calospora MUT 4182]
MNSDAPGGAAGSGPTTPSKNPPAKKETPNIWTIANGKRPIQARRPLKQAVVPSETSREADRYRQQAPTEATSQQKGPRDRPNGQTKRKKPLQRRYGIRPEYQFGMDGDKAPVGAKILGELKESVAKTLELLRRLIDLGSTNTLDSSLRLALEEIASYVITTEDGTGIGKAELFAIVASQQKVIANQQEVSGRLLGLSNGTMLEKITDNRTKHDGNGSGTTPSANPVPIVPRRTTKRSFAAPQMRTSKNPGNPTQIHSPARLILRCMPPISIDKRQDAVIVLSKANQVLEQAEPGTMVRVALESYTVLEFGPSGTAYNPIYLTTLYNSPSAAAQHTDQGNITLVVTGKYKSEDLSPYAAEIGKAIAPGHAVDPSQDSPWYKVIVHAASTHGTRGDSILTAGQLADEIYELNYWLMESGVQLADGCRFLAAPKELKNKTHAEFVMTFEKLEDAKYLVEDQGGLYFSGKWCRADKFEERQQVRQCERCLSLHHGTKSCREKIRCRYCKGDHESWKYICPEPSCGAKGPCPHSQCVNYSEELMGDKCHSADDRRCPEKLRLQGLAPNSKAAKQRSKATTKRIDDEPEQAEGAKPKITAIQRSAIELMRLSVPELSEEKAFQLLVEAKGSTEVALKLAKGEPPEHENEVMKDESTTQSAPNAQPTL